MCCRQINLLLGGYRADVARDVQIEIVLLDLGHLHLAGVSGLLGAVLVSLDDLGDMLGLELVLPFAFLEVLGGIDEQHVVGLLALLERQDAHRDAGGVDEIGGQVNDGIKMSVLEQLGADAFLGTAPKQYTVALETPVVDQRVGGFPAVGERTLWAGMRMPLRG